LSATITISAGRVTLTAELNDSATAKRLAEALPIVSEVMRWGQEVYFETPVSAEPSEDARAEMAGGEIGYWPVGKAMCIFFGATPASGPDGAPRAASPVSPIGQVVDDATALAAVKAGTKITVAAKQG
jgi:hypothetical protein